VRAAERSLDARLSGLAERYCLIDQQKQRLADLLSLLASDQRAPTSVREPGLAIDIHLADSLAALELDLDREAILDVADIGSGAGFPGLPLAISRPLWNTYLLDSQSRKCGFISRALLATMTENAQVICARAEEWRAGMGGQDLVLARALAPQSVVLEYAAPLLRVGGRLIDWRARRDANEEYESAAAGQLLGLEFIAAHPVAPFEGAQHRHLYVYRKVRDTPERFPRRSGVARKRPLAAKD
jgi:16S rRNA (guanine527-N7)-methyltransferase